ncbi:hypothetical protein PVAG01_07446 [Phlyctema vagabunda]|uniref:DUF1772-domain-containing protein n=1 Tax=Phlyctema vagabunda TaxID=108571 RepID=A0ABR4PCG2_9HELO
MESSSTTSIRIAQVLGVTTAGFYTGAVFHQYLNLVPAYLVQPAKPAISRWYGMHIWSKHNLAPAALVGLLSNAFLVVRYHSLPAERVVLGDMTTFRKWKAYTLATLCIASFIPFTAKVMLPINLVLEDYHRGKATISDADAKALLVAWRKKSVVRAWPVGFAAIIGLVIALS